MNLVTYEEAKANPCTRWNFTGENFPGIVFTLGKTLQEMATLCEEKNGLGLAAPQVGIFKRFFLLDFRRKGGGMTWVFNPIMRPLSRRKGRFVEGCLSLPGETFTVERWASVSLEFQDETGQPIKWAACKGLLGVAVQHEMNHLDGICIKDWADMVPAPQFSSEERAREDEAAARHKEHGLDWDFLERARKAGAL